eukprot:GHVU01118711.1.p2 GENE.GHVU01118711.1~~GHVU01118711.1.p2  ORF type:complete len:109 (+),score=25.90 GHVU01118711.1:394-720(+)
MRLSEVVEVEQVEEAIRLFQLATVEANKTIVSREALSPAERECVKAAEDAILKRLPLGARATKNTIVRDLKARGFDEKWVGRALQVLIRKGALEERGDASVRRLAYGA